MSNNEKKPSPSLRDLAYTNPPIREDSKRTEYEDNCFVGLPGDDHPLALNDNPWLNRPLALRRAIKQGTVDIYDPEVQYALKIHGQTFSSWVK